MKPTRAPIGTLLALGALALTVLGVPGMVASGATHQGPTIVPGTVLTNTTLGGYSQIDQIDMLSPRLGYALATGSLGNDRYAYYLVRTTNLGKTWTVQSEIAANLERYPIFSDYNLWDTNSSIDFANAQVGYVDGAGGSLDVTSNGGRTWSQITPANSSTSYALNGVTTSVVITMCPSGATTPTSRCKSEFVLYPTGSTRPIYSTPVQVPGKHYEPSVELLAAAPHGIDVINVNAANFTTATSLRISHDNGRTWEPMANPAPPSPSNNYSSPRTVRGFSRVSATRECPKDRAKFFAPPTTGARGPPNSTTRDCAGASPIGPTRQCPSSSVATIDSSTRP